ncbi:MAG: hypothetical protein Q9211_004973 [Gyalolechia sp. 1 TL-2023]
MGATRHIPLPPPTVVKLDPRDTPPPLHFSPVTSERERSSTADTTPIGTPRTFDNIFRRRSDKERERDRDLLSSYYRKTSGFAGNTSSYVDSALLESDTEDSTFPLFQDQLAEPDMDAPVNIATSSGFTNPRRHQTSNLTSALQSTSGNETRPTPAMNISNGKGPHHGFGRRDSLSSALAASGSHYGSGAQPISMSNANRERPRRESLAGSMVSGMSWGGVSVGSWHYEENHAQSFQQRTNVSQPTALPNSKAAIAASTANAVRQSAQQDPSAQLANPVQSNQTSVASQVPSNPLTPKVQKAQPTTAGHYSTSQRHPSLDDMDAVQDMEMDDDDYNTLAKPTIDNDWEIPNQSRLAQQSRFGQPVSRLPPLDTSALNMGNHLQHHQGLRHSTPTTPVAASRNGNFYQNNPTVSSVNTPTLIAHPVQQQHYMSTPDSSAPATPGEMENDFLGDHGPLDGSVRMGNRQGLGRTQYGNFGGFNFGNGNEMLDLCIDEPAKLLFSANGAYSNSNSSSSTSGPMSNAARLGDAQYSENSELARTIREQQRLAGVPDGGSGPNDGVAKPFHCPVIGCEKAYKNQNGLKYHKAHGHNTQQLHANDNGTFSIVDPETLNPYPGTLGMEKHKPYRCDACGKRYKNLNGLKYHKNHSTACEDSNQQMDSMDTSSTVQPDNPPLASNHPKFPQTGFGTSGMGMGVPLNTNINNTFLGAGLPGIDEEMTL